MVLDGLGWSWKIGNDKWKFGQFKNAKMSKLGNVGIWKLGNVKTWECGNRKLRTLKCKKDEGLNIRNAFLHIRNVENAKWKLLHC